MKLFISWSKPKSKAVATRLHEWIPSVIQRITPWMSSEDIGPGRRWSHELSRLLDETNHGLICVTPENLGEPWLNFEAGALAKSVMSGRIRPVLLGLAPNDVVGPLAQFQATQLTNRGEMLKLVNSLNAECAEALGEAQVVRAFDRAWGEWDSWITKLDRAADLDRPVHRTTDDKIDEILSRLRAMAWSSDRDYSSADPYPARTRLADVTVDLTDIHSSLGVEEVEVFEGMTVSSWLNSLYFSVQAFIPAFTYGKTWVLLDERNGQRLQRLGSFWATEHGLDRDDRELQSAGIRPGMKLHAVRLPADENDAAGEG